MIKIGDTIDNRYNVLSHLGTGGMAVVFECKDLFTGETVAVKIMKEELLNDAFASKNFSQEVKASVAMSHENIIQIRGEGIFQNRPYLVMEFLNVQNLSNKIELLTKFSIKEACQIMLQLLDAISYTHKHKIIHRDVKPENIFYLANGTIKLADFGIAKHEKDAEIDGKINGSVHYLAPEVLVGKPFSIASDIYAAGITFFQLVTGLLPFEGSTQIVADSQLKKPFPKPSEFNNQIPTQIDEIILKATKKNSKQRFKTADDFKIAVQNYLDGKEIKRSIFDRIFK